MSKAPAFQFYANDFMDATCSWEANAVGLYIRCLCKQWTHGGLPNDLKVLARMIHCDRSELEGVWDVLQTKLPEGADGLLRNSRLEEIRERQNEISLKRSEAGRSGVLAKAIASANGNAKTKQRKVKVKEKVKEKKEGEVENAEMMPWPTFDDFWTAYERKGNRKATEQEWAKIDQKEREAIMDHVPYYNSSKPDKQFRKDGERYLRGRVWEDEIVIPTNIAAKSQTKNLSNDEYAQSVAEALQRKFARDAAERGRDQ
jgi:hypothetical protein